MFSGKEAGGGACRLCLRGQWVSGEMVKKGSLASEMDGWQAGPCRARAGRVGPAGLSL